MKGQAEIRQGTDASIDAPTKPCALCGQEREIYWDGKCLDCFEGLEAEARELAAAAEEAENDPNYYPREHDGPYGRII